MSRAQDAAIQMAETIQTASIVDAPSVEHDMNPSTAASEKEPVRIDQSPSEDAMSDIEEDEVPISVLRPMPRKPQMPPLPDLRFEQSYLSSIRDAKDWKVVTYITMRDQVCFPSWCACMDCAEVLTFYPDLYAFGPGYGMDTCCIWLETFEPLFSTSRTVCRCED